MLRDHPHLTAEGLDREIYLVSGGRTLAGFDAVRHLAARLPLLSPLGLLMYLPGAVLLGRPAYRWVADHRRTVLACRIGEPTIVHKALASLLIVAVLAAAAAGSVFRTEDWPLTCVPMFATPVEPDGARYSFRIRAVDAKGKSKELPSSACGVPELRLKRLLFRAYGSVSEDDPYGGRPGDTPAAFEARMTAFFRAWADAARGRGNLAGARRLRLEVVREAGGRSERHRVGTYDLGTREFRREPR